MKKLALCSILLLFLFTLAGCNKKDIDITTEDITVNTIVAKADGKLQVALVDLFDKPYYNLNELEEFAQNEINEYNKSIGEDKVVMDDIELKDGKAVIILSFAGMEQYANFNQVSAAYFNGGIKDNPLSLPETLVNADGEETANTQEVLQNQKYKIIVLNELYDIIVDGTVKFYSENASLGAKNMVHGAAEGMTVVVYKP
ncbi:MAG: hypothetical protein K0S76_2699 [Herbinix sp.]|jgi:predicted small lipoprotein YifL|nr:hypothetical protein [Herbinix sp.]